MLHQWILPSDMFYILILFLFCTSIQYSFKFMTEDSILICKLIGLVIGDMWLELEMKCNNSIAKPVQNLPLYFEQTNF